MEHEAQGGTFWHAALQGRHMSIWNRERKDLMLMLQIDTQGEKKRGRAIFVYPKKVLSLPHP
jgi:hypothetical protein